MAGEVSFTPTVADYVGANRANLIWSWRRGRTWRAWGIMVAVCAALGAVLGSLYGRAETIEFASIYAVLGLVLMPAVHAIGYALFRPRLARLVRQQPSATLPQTWAWDAEGLTISHAQGSARHRWAELFGWHAGRFGVVLYVNERSLFPLPCRALSDSEAADLRNTITHSGLQHY